MGGSELGKTNVIVNLMKHQEQIKFIYMSKIYLNQSINCLLTEEKVRIEKLKNPKALIDYWWKIYYVYENLEDFNLTKKKRVLIVFDGMTADMESNKIIYPIVTNLFLRGRKLNIWLVFMLQSYFKVPIIL